MGSDLGSQGDSREQRFADEELATNSESEILKEANSELGTEGTLREVIPGPIYVVAMGTNFELLYLRAYSNAFKILEDRYKKRWIII